MRFVVQMSSKKTLVSGTLCGQFYFALFVDMHH